MWLGGSRLGGSVGVMLVPPHFGLFWSILQPSQYCVCIGGIQCYPEVDGSQMKCVGCG